MAIDSLLPTNQQLAKKISLQLSDFLFLPPKYLLFFPEFFYTADGVFQVKKISKKCHHFLSSN
jgi:hypothetical protein